MYKRQLLRGQQNPDLRQPHDVGDKQYKYRRSGYPNRERCCSLPYIARGGCYSNTLIALSPGHHRCQTGSRHSARRADDALHGTAAVSYTHLDVYKRQGLRSLSEHLGNDYRRVRIGIGHPGDKALVHNYVLSDFAKADTAWVAALCDAIAAHAGLLVKGEDEAFQRKVQQAMETAGYGKAAPI